MRHLFALTAAAAALVAVEAHAQVREVVLFPAAGLTLARKAAPHAAPLPVSMEARTLNWPGKRESRYSPRASAHRPAQTPAQTPAPAPLPAVYAPLPQAAAPTPFIYAPVYAPPAARPAPVAVFVPMPRIEAPRPAPASVAVAAPVRQAPPAFVPTPAQVEAPAPVAAAPVAAPVPALTPAAPTTAAAAPASAREPWKTRTGDNGPRFYSVHRQFGYTPDPTRVSSDLAANASADRLPAEFFGGATPTDEPGDEMTEQQQQPRRVEKKSAKKGRR